MRVVPETDEPALETHRSATHEVDVAIAGARPSGIAMLAAMLAALLETLDGV